MLLEDVLDAGGVEYRRTSRDYEVTLNCPFCPLRGFTEDNKFHFGLNISNGLAHCYRCNWRSGSLIHTVRQLSSAFHVPLRMSFVSTSRVPTPKEDKHKEKIRLIAVGLPMEYEQFTGCDDPLEKEARKYLRSRGVSLSQIARHNIGYAGAGALSWRVLFPVLGEDSKVYGCVARAIRSDMEPKYLNTSGTKLLWNAHTAGSVAVIAEGVMDALQVEKALMVRKDWVPVASLGSTITAVQLQQLKKYERIVILPDRDSAGVKGAQDLATLCAEEDMRVEIAVPSVMDGVDPGSMSEQQILSYIDSAVPWKTETRWRMRASRMREVV